MTEPILITSTPSSYSSMFQKMLENDMKDITNAMAIPKEYFKYNGNKEFEKELTYRYINNNIIFDPIACEIYWEGVRNNLKNKIANSNATTFIEVNDEC